MQIFQYKDHVIYPTPRLQVETGYWKVQLTIRYKAKVKPFVTGNIFSTRAEAVFHSIDYGKKLIDEGIQFETGDENEQLADDSAE